MHIQYTHAHAIESKRHSSCWDSCGANTTPMMTDTRSKEPRPPLRLLHPQAHRSHQDSEDTRSDNHVCMSVVSSNAHDKRKHMKRDVRDAAVKLKGKKRPQRTRDRTASIAQRRRTHSTPSMPKPHNRGNNRQQVFFDHGYSPADVRMWATGKTFEAPRANAGTPAGTPPEDTVCTDDGQYTPRHLTLSHLPDGDSTTCNDQQSLESSHTVRPQGPDPRHAPALGVPDHATVDGSASDTTMKRVSFRRQSLVATPPHTPDLVPDGDFRFMPNTMPSPNKDAAHAGVSSFASWSMRVAASQLRGGVKSHDVMFPSEPVPAPEPAEPSDSDSWPAAVAGDAAATSSSPHCSPSHNESLTELTGLLKDSSRSHCDPTNDSGGRKPKTKRRVRWCPILSQTLSYPIVDPDTGDVLEGRAARDQARRDVLGSSWQETYDIVYRDFGGRAYSVEEFLDMEDAVMALPDPCLTILGQQWRWVGGNTPRPGECDSDDVHMTDSCSDGSTVDDTEGLMQGVMYRGVTPHPQAHGWSRSRATGGMHNALKQNQYATVPEAFWTAGFDDNFESLFDQSVALYGDDGDGDVDTAGTVEVESRVKTAMDADAHGMSREP
eukprot:m.41360 g.41360  ORF g.41360 m.41360 type:complete len:606 (-) comp6122_c0_seq1:247-2064(-)